MMAAGRGEFFRSFKEGLQRQPAQQAPDMGRPNRGGGFAGQGRGFSGPRRKERKVATRSSGVETEASSQTRPPKKVSQRKSSPCKLNLLERLPSEILVKILSYLDPSSLFCLSHVSRLLHRLSNDDVLWQRIYTSEFGSRMWKLKTSDGCVVREDTAEGEYCSTNRWKKLYFKSMAGQEMIKWRKHLRDISPYTGLPQQTEWVLRNLNVSWELTFCDHLGQERTLEQSRAHFFETSVIVHWSVGIHMMFQHISTIQLHGVRKGPQSSPTTRKPNWRSLILKLDTETQFLFIGKDKLIKVFLLQPGVIVGIWRGKNQVAFIMISLHFHRLVEKSLVGSPACPYSESMALPFDDLDPELGLHDYSLHFVLHNTGTEIMSGHFQQLFCRKAQIQRGLVELRVIQRTRLSQHRSLSGSIKLPWRHEDLEGAVENCCIMSLTLLDEFQKPFWCVSSPIHITMAKRTLSFDYSGRDFQMLYRNPDGEVRMLLVWLEEQKQFFLIGLTIYVPVAKVNKRFNREY